MSKDFLSDTEMADIEQSSGSADFISDKEMDQLASQGKRPSPEQSAIRQGASGVVGGFDDELIGGISAAGRVAGVTNLGSWKPFDPESKLEFSSPTLSPQEIMNAYRENRDLVRADQKKDFETNPKASFAGNFVGSLTSPVSKLAAPQKIFGPLTKGQALAQASKTAALQGAVFSAGNSDADLTKGEFGKFALDTGTGTALGAVIPPAIHTAGKGISKATQATGNAAGWVGRKVLNTAFGLTDEVTQKYLAHPDRINGAKSLEEIKILADEGVERLREAVKQGEITEFQAKETLKAMKEQVTRGLADRKVDAKDALRAAESAFEGARQRVLEPLKSRSAPTHLAADATEMVGDLKTKVQAASGDAVETLKTSAAEIDLNPVYKSIDDAVTRLEGAGTDESLGVASKLRAYKERLMSQNWAKIPAIEAKRLIQGLDAITEYSPMAGSFDQAKSRAFKEVRNAFDRTIKDTVPEYRERMKDVAQLMSVLDRSNKSFGTPQAATSKIGSLHTPRGQLERATLLELEQATGKVGAISKEADDFARVQKILKDPSAVRQIEQSLPEYQTLRQSMADVAKRNPKWTRQQIEQATAKERRNLAEAVSRRITAEKQLAPYKRLSPNSSENTIKSVMKGEKSNIENRKMLEQLGKETGNDFIQMADDLRIKQAFDKPFHQGARNTLFGSVMGTVFGGVIGGVPGALGMGGMGASYGALVDRFGPKMGKAVLDGFISLRNSPNVQTIRSLNLPASVKQEMEREFRVYVNANHGSEGGISSRVAGGDSDSNRKPAKKEQHFANGGEVKTLGQIIGYPGESTAPKPDQKQVKHSYAHGGGPIPGVAAVKGDSPKNDTVRARLSPGEIVLPRSVTMAKNAPVAAAEFVHAHLKKSGKRGEDKWAAQGMEKLGLSDESLLSDPKTKKLLIEASDHPVGSPKLKQIMEKIRKGLGAR